MATASTTFHEPEERLTEETRDLHRGIVSLMEELEAIDWYQQRIDGTRDEELRAILRHNRDEEMEHAALLLGQWTKPGQLLGDLLDAVEILDAAGIAGPYAAVLPPDGYYGYLKAVADGGYRQHDGDAVHLMCVETVAGQLTSPQAVCLLVTEPRGPRLLVTEPRCPRFRLGVGTASRPGIEARRQRSAEADTLDRFAVRIP